jgi:predicted PurR-regulated permease PerM
VKLEPHPSQESHPLAKYGGWVAERTLVASAVLAGVVLVMLLLWKAAVVFLLLFVAILLAILFQGLAELIRPLMRSSYGVRLTAVLAIALAALALGVYLRAPAVAIQLGALRDDLPDAAWKVQEALAQHPWGRQVLVLLPDSDTLMSEASSRASALFSVTLSAFGYFLFVLFTFLFVAYQPKLYRSGTLLMVPPSHRERASEILDKVWETLWWWLAARGAAMLFVGVVVTVGLTILDIPLALTLGLIAALLDFVPNFGPFVAAIPAVLLAAVKGPDEAFMVAGLYFVVQLLEGNLVTPLAQKRAIDMAPALVVVSQFALGAVFGAMGLVVATPLVAAVLVVLREVYVKNEKGDRVRVGDQISL